MTQKRHKGITLIGWYFIVNGAVLFLTSVSLVRRSVINGGFVFYDFWQVSLGLIGIFVFVTGVNLLRLKEFFRRAALCFSGTVFILNIMGIFSSGSHLIGEYIYSAVASVLNLFFIYFLTRKNVVSQFVKG